MIPLIRKSLVGPRLTISPTQIISQVTRTLSSRTVPNVTTSCSCCCGRSQEDKIKGTNSLLLRCRSTSIPTYTQSSSISSSHVATASVSSESDNPMLGKTVMWDLYAGVVVERKPVITATKNELQDKYAELMNRIEYEISKKSDHEVRLENDIKMLEKVKTGDLDLGNVEIARDDEDRWNAEAQAFQPASRETDADRKKNMRSLDRALDSHLLLVVEQKLGKDYRWICPHVKLEQGESLRQATERMLRLTFPEMRTKILGNAPWGFYKYKYPKEADTKGSTGAKVFFYKAQVISGDANTKTENSEIKDFFWLKRDELQSKLQPEYYKRLSECLIDE